MWIDRTEHAVTIHTKGILKGRTIELDREVGLPEGSTVEVAIKGAGLSLEEKRRIIDELASWGKDDPTFIAALEEVVRERERNVPREVNFDAAP